MSLQVGLNGTSFTNLPSGANQRFLGIYGNLAQSLPSVQFSIFTLPGNNLNQQFPQLKNVEMIEVPINSSFRALRYLQGLSVWKKYLAQKRLDIYEQFHLPLFKAPEGSTILTIHDIRAVATKRSYLERTIGQFVFSTAIKKTDHIVTVSHSMKQEILNFFPKAKVSVIYNGYETNSFPSQSELYSFKQAYSLPDQFLLSVGHLEPRKNYARLIEALAVLRDRGQSHCLVIVGNNNGDRATLQKLIESRRLTSQVRLLSQLSHRELQCAYMLSHLFIFPSVYEGFGIPILEAMAAQTPMILSDISVFREITENQGIYFSPHDTGDLADKIANTIDADSERNRLISYGNGRLEQFKYSSLANQLKELYRSLGYSLT